MADQRSGEALSRDGARCSRCGHYETDYDHASSLYAHCPSCSRHTRWERVPCPSEAWVPSVGDRVLIGGTSLVELRGRAGVVRDVRGGEALVELAVPGLGAMRTDWLFFEQLIPDRSHDPRPNEALPVDTEDDDPANMNCRAGYLRGLASRRDGTLTREDRDMLVRASRSLVYAAERCSEPARPEPIPADDGSMARARRWLNDHDGAETVEHLAELLVSVRAEERAACVAVIRSERDGWREVLAKGITPVRAGGAVDALDDVAVRLEAREDESEPALPKPLEFRMSEGDRKEFEAMAEECQESPEHLPGELAVLHRIIDAKDAKLVALRKVAEAARAVCDDSQGVDAICDGVLRRHMKALRDALTSLSSSPAADGSAVVRGVTKEGK